MMEINMLETVNILIAIFLLLKIAQRRDVTTLLLALFIYGTLHFSFAAISLAANDYASLLITMHNKGGGMLAKLSAFSLLGVVFALLSIHAYDVFLLSQEGENKALLYILSAMAALLCGYALNIRHNDWLQLKNVISIEAMLALIMLGYFSSNGVRTLTAANIFSWGLGGLVILGATDCIAIFEVFTRHAWSAYVDSSGAVIYRASSILFNPNLLSFWASLAYLSYAYGLHVCKGHQKIMLSGMVLASISIYMSGSRSTGFLLLGLSFISELFIKERLRWAVLMILPLTMLTIYCAVVWLVTPLISNNEGWREIALLGERFVVAPLYLANYVSMKTSIFSDLFAGIFTNIHMGAPSSVPMGTLSSIPTEVALSIEGRFMGDGKDSGWLVLYQDTGWFGTLAIIWISILLLLWGMRTCFVKRSAANVYALSAVCYCLLSGLIMRFQVFPIWLFIGVILIPCIAYWKRSAASIPFRQIANARAYS